MPTDTPAAVSPPNAAIVLRADVQARIEDFRPLLPPHVPPERFVRIVLTAVAKNPALIVADRRSFLNGCLAAAQDGLPPDGRLSALVVRKDSNGREIVGYERMVAGWRELASRAGCTALYARIVFAKDQFSFREGLDRTLSHQPAAGDRGPPIGAYAVAKFADGREPDWIYLDWAAIQKRRNASRAKSDKAPWAQWTNEMAEKTVVKALCNDLMLAGNILATVDVEGADGDEPRDITPARPTRAEFAPAPEAITDAGSADPGVDADPDTGELLDPDAAAHLASISKETPAVIKDSLSAAQTPRQKPGYAVPLLDTPTAGDWLAWRDDLVDRLTHDPTHWPQLEASNAANIVRAPADYRAFIGQAIARAKGEANLGVG